MKSIKEGECAMKEKKAIRLYLILLFVFCYGLGLVELFTRSGKAFEILHVAFTPLPVICGLLVARKTGEREQYAASLKVWKSWKWWAFSAIMPGILISLGAVAYFLIFPGEYSGILVYGKFLGNAASMPVGNVVVFALVCIASSAFMIPIQLLELGEEVGWRGFLLKWQVNRHGQRKAILINGLEWGIMHLPLICFGFNYSLSNWGAPWSNMLMMIVMCMVLGILFSYVTIRTGNCMYAAIMHGVVNTIGEVPVLLKRDLESGLLGPNPTGIIGMSLLIVLAIIILWRLKEPVESVA